MKKWLLLPGGMALIVFALLLILVCWNIRDRHPGYEIDLQVAADQASSIQAGFAALPITPELVDTWTDRNGDARFSEADGDTFRDNNGNGKFDAYWMAGFGNSRAANGVHDDLWARTMVVDDGHFRLALVVLDVIGLHHDDVVDIRKLVAPSGEVDYTVVVSTHNHEAPDLLGLWGESNFKSGVDPLYLQYVKRRTARSVDIAVTRLRPARFRVAQDLKSAVPLVTDTRRPHVLDAGLRMIHVIDRETDATLGAIVAWGDHPETLWDKNLLLTSDYPHYVREGIEKGVYRDGSLHTPGLGGIALFVNGAIGGLMTTKDSMAVADPFGDAEYIQPSFAKARAQGTQVALIALNALNDEGVEVFETGGIQLRARTVHLPLDNSLFRFAAALGVLDRGLSGWITLRSEVAAWRLGDLSFICVPGEIYPEIVQGGIESPVGQDYAIEPLEVPSLRSLMPGRFKFVLGLANDEIGYIIPKSEWDEIPPYLYDSDKPTYGEIVSMGPETAPILHSELKTILGEMQVN